MFRSIFEGYGGFILLLLIVVLFGAKRLPDAAKSVGKSIKAFKSEMDSDKPTEPKDSDKS